MKDSYLNDISNALNGSNSDEIYQFSFLTISMSLFPKSFYDTVIHFLKSANKKYRDDVKIKNFNVIFTEDGSIYFEFTGNNGLTKLVVAQNNIDYNNILPCKFIRSSVFFDELLKQEKKIYLEIKNSLPKEFQKKYLKEEGCIEKELNEELSKAAKIIIDYARFINKERKFSIEKINFQEREERRKKRRNTIFPGAPKEERKNEVIPILKREKVLDGKKHIFEFEAIPDSKREVYLVKVYKVKNIGYSIIMEPKSGEKYTRVAHIKSDEKLNKQTIKAIVSDSLSKSRNLSENVTQHSHTTLETFVDLIDYILESKDNGLSYNSKNTIDNARKK